MYGNPTITKTSDEEGKYAEVLFKWLIEKKGGKCTDVSNDREYQHLDIDFLVGNSTVEIKNDIMIEKTGNAVYEFRTHLNESEKRSFERETANMNYISRDVINKYGGIGCNEKCCADLMFYLSTVEDTMNRKHYSVNWNYPILLIDNRKFKAYVSENLMPKNKVKVVYHPEDDCYNIIFIMNYFKMIEAGIARLASEETVNILKSCDVFSKSVMSKDLPKLLKEWNG